MPKWITAQVDNTPVQGPCGAPDSVIRLLEKRGVSAEMAADFLSDRPRESYDCFLFKGIRQVAEHIIDSLDAGKKICIYGDYDADGVTSTALLLCVFSRFSKRLCYHVPSRFKDGYGLNTRALQELADTEKPDLLVTVDCGSTSSAEVAFAQELGMEVIVTDHHSLTEGAMPACTVLNPKDPDCGYPFKDLSGCGVAFKLAQAIQRVCAGRGDERFTHADLADLLDLVAISTVADVVPLLSENRSLVKYGLKLINERRRPGIRALLEVLDLKREITADNIAFILAPHINALGRMQSADLAVELLSGIGCDYGQLRRMAEAMAENNMARREAQNRTKALCLEAMEKEDCGSLMPVVYAQGGHEGVAGIVAGNLKEMLYRPVLVLTDSPDGNLKGTGRCIPGLDLHGMLEANQELFLRFGGHAGACGFSIEKDKLPLLRERMQNEAALRLAGKEDLLEEKLYIEKELSAEEKTLDFAGELNRLEPFGEGNPRPIFSMLSCRIRDPRFMGKDGQHLRFTAKAEKDGVPVSCVLFGRAAEYKDIVRDGAVLDVAGELEINEFNGRCRLQLMIKDIKRQDNED